VPELLRAFSGYRMIVYSLLLIVVMIFKPSGLMGMYDFSLSHVIEKVMNRTPGRKQRDGKAGEENG